MCQYINNKKAPVYPVNKDDLLYKYFNNNSSSKYDIEDIEEFLSNYVIQVIRMNICIG